MRKIKQQSGFPLDPLIKQSHEHGVDLGKNVEKYKHMDKKDDPLKGFADLFGFGKK